MKKTKKFYIHPKILKAWESQKRFVIIHGGRGSGKSMQVAALCIFYAIQNPNSRILCVRGCQNKISESSLQQLKMVISYLGIDSYFTITENTLSCKNGSEFLFYGARNYQSFKSLQGIKLCWVDEAVELVESAFLTLIPTIREDNSRFLISFNPEHEKDACYQMFIANKHPNAEVVQINFDDNPYFPDVLKDDMEYDKSVSLVKYSHIWLGELITAVEGALWKPEHFVYLSEEQQDNILEQGYGNFYEKVIVSVDPSTTSNAKTSDACGIVVIGKHKKLCKFDVLDDQTGVMSPQSWAQRAILLFEKYEANFIIYESNQGGQMVSTIIKQIDPSIPCRSVFSSKNKVSRAEPVASIYEQGLVNHWRKFTNLEYECQTYDGKGKSPNAMDAMVHGITYLNKKDNTVTQPLNWRKVAI